MKSVHEQALTINKKLEEIWTLINVYEEKSQFEEIRVKKYMASFQCRVNKILYMGETIQVKELKTQSTNE